MTARRRWCGLVACIVALACVAGCGEAASSTRPPAAVATVATAPPRGVRVMPLGDSITSGVRVRGGYRSDLWQLMNASSPGVDFVGSSASGPAELRDRDHEGHPGWEIAQLDARVRGWLTEYRPDIVLLHIGTNDVLRHHALANAPTRLSALLGHITTTLPSAQVYVATIIPLGRASIDRRARVYNASVTRLVRARAAVDPHVHLVDMHSALGRKDLTVDGIHPNKAGYSAMAARWFAALRGTAVTRWQAETVGRTSVNDGERLTDRLATGTGKVGYLNYPDSYVEFSVTSPDTGWHRVFVRGANGMKGTCTQTVRVNGRPQGTVRYPGYGWDHWTITAFTTWLRAGTDTLRFSHATCAAELDAIDIAPGAL